jgi:hypothetical protein
MLARFRPSPALVIAGLALFIGLGGVGYAVVAGVPDSNGVFHGCVARATGATRIVPSSTQCHPATPGQPNSGEKAVAWSQTGPVGANGKDGVNGTTIIARLRGTSTFTTTSTAQTVPINPSSWQQKAKVDNQLIGQATVEAPSAANCSFKVVPSVPAQPGIATLRVIVDGVAAVTVSRTAAGDTQTNRLGTVNSIAGGSLFTHHVELSVLDNCGLNGGAATDHFKIRGAAFDVLQAQ